MDEFDRRRHEIFAAVLPTYLKLCQQEGAPDSWVRSSAILKAAVFSNRAALEAVDVWDWLDSHKEEQILAKPPAKAY